MPSLLLRTVLIALAASSVSVGCASSRERTRAAEAWTTNVTPGLSKQLEAICPLRQSQPLTFLPVANRAQAAALLEAPSFVPLSAGETTRFGGASLALSSGVPLLLRAVRMLPPDGVLTVTACGTVLYVNYTGAPSDVHTGLERFPVLTLAPTLPTHVIITFGQGIP